MAEDGERRMLFDTRGRRKNVIRVVYAILALLMATSLFFVVGPVNIGELIGNSATSSASQVLDEQAERIEARLAEEPRNEDLLLALTRTRISAGNSRIEVGQEGQTQEVPGEAKDEFEQALEAWNRYLKLVEEPSATVAQLVAGTFFRLAESDTSVRAAEENVEQAAEAQRIAAKARPSVGSLSTLAIYEFFNGDFAAGNRAAAEAAAKAPSKAEAKAIKSQMAEYRKNAKQFAKRKKQLAKAEEQLGQGQSGNPFSLPGGGGSVAE